MNRQQRRQAERAEAEAAARQAAQPDVPPSAPEQHQQMTVTIASTGRHVMISFPVDMTESEQLEFAGWLTNTLRLHLAAIAEQTAGGRIILPSGVRPPQRAPVLPPVEGEPVDALRA